MSEAALMLRNPPIVEAVVDIECDFKPGQKLNALEEPARQRFGDSYPKFRPQFLQELQIQLKENESVTQSKRQGIQAFQFLKDDEKQLVQVRSTGYSFNRLSPYTSFDDYLPEIQRTWDLYREVATPIQIKLVRLRYINRIRLPFADSRVELDEYFELGPRLPDEERLTMVGFLNQYVAVEADTGHQVTTVLTAQQPEKDCVPIIFDNAAAAMSPLDPENWDRLEATLEALRALKNRVFRNTLSDKCLHLFQ